MLIEKNHPLNEIPITKALPSLEYFRCCFKKPKKSFKFALRQSLLEKLDIRMPKSEIKLEEDPYLRLGFGMNAYFDTLKILIYSMLFICIFTIPNMHIYSEGNGIKEDLMGFITQYSLGNMGGAEGYCK